MAVRAGCARGGPYREPQGRDDESACGLRAQERRAVQREDNGHRVLRSQRDAQRRSLVHGDHEGRRPDLLPRSVPDDDGFQEAAGRGGLESNAVRGEVVSIWDSPTEKSPRSQWPPDWHSSCNIESIVSRGSTTINSAVFPGGHLYFALPATRRSLAAVAAAISLALPVAPSAGGPSNAPAVTGATVRIDNFGRIDAHYYRGSQPEGRDYTDLAAI